MDAKQKAKELVDKYLKLDIEIGGQFDGYLTMKIHDAKECAKIAVREICDALNWHELDMPNEEWDYWAEVGREIDAL